MFSCCLRSSISPIKKLKGHTMRTKQQNHQNHQQSLPIKLITWVLYSLIAITLLHFYFFPIYPTPAQTPLVDKNDTIEHSELAPLIGKNNTLEHSELANPQPTQPECDYFNGKWVESTTGPFYNGTSCSTIKKGQNCMVHGRPDSGFLYWRWKPENCQMPPFNPTLFLELLKNRHMAFIGDSMARNQLESLLCMLSTKSQPELVYSDSEENKFRRWIFKEYNTTVSVFWSPFLVKGLEKSAATGLNHNKLYLDSADEKWASDLNKLDVMVFSVGHWFLHPAIYYEGERVLGCHHCPEFNHTEVGFFGVFRKAINTTLQKVKDEVNWSNKLVVLTTFSPAHFEGEWDKAGACPKKEPYKQGEKEMEYTDAEMRKVELEEVAVAAKEVETLKGRLRIEALDVTNLALMRPDGHPGPYMNPDPFAEGNKERVQNDCVHWCLPGPIDTWNEILLNIVRRWRN